MKKIYAALCLLMAGHASAQTFTLLANDAQGDVTVSYIPDIQSLHYSASLAQDSLWFRVETFTAVSPNGDAGIMFGLDTNLNPADGLAWNGANSSMNFDMSLIIFQNIIFPTYYGYIYSAAGSVSVPVTVLRPDSFTFIISVQLSLLDNDGQFNLLMGQGGFDILSTLDVYDEVPNTGFLTIPVTTGLAELKSTSWTAYPNPATSFLHLRTDSPHPVNGIAYLYDASGRETRKINLMSKEQTIDLSGLCDGVYQVIVSSESGAFSTRLLIQ